jgi:hypothetical protein
VAKGTNRGRRSLGTGIGRPNCLKVYYNLVGQLNETWLSSLRLPLDDGADPSFVCERVCTSDRLMRRMGGLAKVITSSAA